MNLLRPDAISRSQFLVPKLRRVPTVAADESYTVAVGCTWRWQFPIQGGSPSHSCGTAGTNFKRPQAWDDHDRLERLQNM